MLDEPLFSAADWWKHQRPPGAPPRAVILAHTRHLLGRARRWFARPVHGFAADGWWLKPRALALFENFGIGAPATAALVDQLAAWGVMQIVSIGFAGGLQPHLQPGDVVLVERAARGEGTSAHYMPPSAWANADVSLTHHLRLGFNQHSLTAQLGDTWTTDAPFRELRGTVLAHQRAGVLAVEMEAAALFAVAQVHGLAAAAVLVIADTLADGHWRWNPADPAPRRALQQVLKAVLACLPLNQ